MTKHLSSLDISLLNLSRHPSTSGRSGFDLAALLNDAWDYPLIPGFRGLPKVILGITLSVEAKVKPSPYLGAIIVSLEWLQEP